MGLTTPELAEKNRSVEYGNDAQNRAKIIGKM